MACLQPNEFSISKCANFQPRASVITSPFPAPWTLTKPKFCWSKIPPRARPRFPRPPPPRNFWKPASPRSIPAILTKRFRFWSAPNIDPKTKQVWNDLGLALLAPWTIQRRRRLVSQTDRSDPYDEHVYNYLGLTLTQQEKFPEAIEAFKKQIEINPLDNVAHAALGGIYLDQHKFSDAVPELDKATVLAPDNAELEVSLGRALLNSGQKDKAMDAFDKAIDMAQTPVLWNNVAYNLSEDGLELEKARQYAESAVSTTAAALRNVGLLHLTLDDLNQVSSLGVYWDTLGWVHFKQGDLDVAERYVRASWLLNQHGEVGDHLAQIYEKRGDKQKAVDLYAEAMAAQHSVPETRARLIVLLGTNAGIDALVAKAKTTLVKSREFLIADGLKQDAKADFFVLLSPGTAAAKKAERGRREVHRRQPGPAAVHGKIEDHRLRPDVSRLGASEDRASRHRKVFGGDRQMYVHINAAGRRARVELTSRPNVGREGNFRARFARP